MPITTKSSDSPPEQYYTNAHPDYDWGWTKTLIDNVGVDKRGRVVRLVEISDGYHADYQVGRYASGGCSAWDAAQLQEEVKLGYVTLTPEAEIHLFSHFFDFRPIVGDDAKYKELRPILTQYSDKKGSVSLSSVGNYGYQLAVKGPKESAKATFDALVAQIEDILAS